MIIALALLAMPAATQYENVPPCASASEVERSCRFDLAFGDIVKANVYVARAVAGHDYYSVKITLSDDAAERFGKIQQKALGRDLAIFADGTFVSKAFWREKVKGRKLQISGAMSLEEALEVERKLLALKLDSSDEN
ncbi:hypothetical protein [Sphingorhabdus sp. Alg239-R122]|uniref:SecDF P1 head subdomain-containing protein n=1 Tax=Sphingorhabdus sp. Alg239-R122 TaxID=2305989 RepID=UPI0013D96C9F|nr:hypothetical protein [Sphingorhabdus sp. Alg239-R122]